MFLNRKRWEKQKNNDLSVNSNCTLAFADALWESLQTKISAFVNQHSGQANIIPHTTHRPDWVIIKKVIDGELPLSTLSTDCP